MNPRRTSLAVIALCLIISLAGAKSRAAQPRVEPGDPAPPAGLPSFWKSTVEDIQAEMTTVKHGDVRVLAESPGGLPVYLVSYGKAERFQSSANYNSAVGAGNPAYYAQKNQRTKPVVLLLGPVHGQEVEGIVGLLNLIKIAETGSDYRGRDWSAMRERLQALRLLIVPCANPDGRRRCPYDSFVGLPTRTMTKYGQGTRQDGSLYGWPGAKAVHPMKGDVRILGAYFNDAGVNIMHDEFFSPFAKETKAILDLVRAEAPDIVVSLHSHESKPAILQTGFVPLFVTDRIKNLAEQLKSRYEKSNLPTEQVSSARPDDRKPPARTPFNLASALHHVSGATSFVFECPHGSLSDEFPRALVTHDQVLDIQLLLYDEIFSEAIRRREAGSAF